MIITQLQFIYLLKNCVKDYLPEGEFNKYSAKFEQIQLHEGR